MVGLSPGRHKNFDPADSVKPQDQPPDELRGPVRLCMHKIHRQGQLSHIHSTCRCCAGSGCPVPYLGWLAKINPHRLTLTVLACAG